MPAQIIRLRIPAATELLIVPLSTLEEPSAAKSEENLPYHRLFAELLRIELSERSQEALELAVNGETQSVIPAK